MSPTLDLETLQLKKGAHSKFEDGACIMEAVAYVAGEPWSDHPACASPVISAFLRSYNDSVSDEVRQTLKPFIPRLVGTASTPEVESRRAIMATDWLIRVHTPAWLRLAGLTAHADALAGFPEITALAQIPSIMAPLDAARKDSAAARAAARDAAWAARAAAWAARAAARDAAWAARDAAWAARDAAWAARAAARDAAWAARAAAGDAAGAARAAAGDAAWAARAARAAARDAAEKKLAPTVLAIQATIPALIERMIDCR